MRKTSPRWPSSEESLLDEFVQSLRAQSETIQDEDLAHISPLICTHVVPNGTYHFEQTDRGG